MAKCWERRGCDDEMTSRCPHNNPAEKCPSRCAYGQCYSATHVPSSDPALIFDPAIDRDAAMKEQCTFCAFFLAHAPRTQ
jgi:hypothetical protein